MKRYSLKKISPEKVRESVLSTLKRQGLVDKKGNILVEEIESILSPERKSFTKKLVEISDAIQKNPSVRKMQNILRDLDNLANFGAKNRSSEQRMFGNISRSAKEAFFDSMEGIAKPKDVEALRAARKTYATKKPMYERLESATFADPEKVVKGAGSQLTGSMIKDTVAAIPELKKPLGDVVIANIVKRGTTPQSLSRAIDEFGRDTLKQILDDDTFKKLMDAEKRFHVSRKPFVRGEAPKVEPFTPRQMPDPEMAKIYKWLSGFLGKPARGGQFGKSIGPILQAGKKYGEQVF
jgi:hypothetical protein